MAKEIDKLKKGEFFTPDFLVKEAHEIILSEFGNDWKEKFIIWDCAAGELSLTRNYKFKELFCSTLEQVDIDLSIDKKNNPEAIKFQFDFLNDNLNNLPEILIKKFQENKEILFFINPPYATPSDNDRDGSEKSGLAKTEINKLMRANKMNLASRQLYCQFLYRIVEIKKQYNLTNINIALFSPPSFITANSYKEFSDLFFKHFNFRQGILFRASHFEDVKSKWGVSFTIWSNSKMTNDLILSVREIDKNNQLVTTEYKKLKPISKHLGEWIDKSYDNLIDAPQMSSALKIKEDGKGRWLKDSLGFFFNGSNNIGTSEHNMGIFSSPYSNNQGFSITENNIMKVFSSFTAKKVIKSNWQNWQDEFSSPNENHLTYQQFNNDAIIYSLFETKSNQSALRDINYKNKIWNIKNEFFWLSKEEMMGLALKYDFKELYQDALNSDERYIYKLLSNNNIILSSDAKEILEMASDLLIKSFVYREEFHLKHPEYHLFSFDAGYAQLKLLWKEYLPEETKEFRKKYKDFEKRLELLIYQLEFL